MNPPNQKNTSSTQTCPTPRGVVGKTRAAETTPQKCQQPPYSPAAHHTTTAGGKNTTHTKTPTQPNAAGLTLNCYHLLGRVAYTPRKPTISGRYGVPRLPSHTQDKILHLHHLINQLQHYQPQGKEHLPLITAKLALKEAVRRLEYESS